jgi:hypothetical protein
MFTIFAAWCAFFLISFGITFLMADKIFKPILTNQFSSNDIYNYQIKPTHVILLGVWVFSGWYLFG